MAASAPRPRVFTIPSGAPFLATLADALLSGRLVAVDRGDPLALADLTVLLPTRRAVRAFRETLIARLGGEAAILPTVRPIGNVDEEEHLLAGGGPGEATADGLALPPTVSRLGRRLALTELTLAWGRHVRRELLGLAPDQPLAIPAAAADAARLAGDLAHLLDDMETAGLPWDALGALVPDDHARYFQITLDFLKIVAGQWPAHIAEIDRVDPAMCRDQLIRAAAARLRARPPGAPIVAAGSTGSIPATAELLTAIAADTHGAVVLPGLDQGVDDSGWAAIGEAAGPTAATEDHPQFGLKQLLAAIGIARHDVIPLADDPAASRARFVSEAMRPAETVEAWTRTTLPDDPLAGVDLIVARNEQEEATAIALAIREAVERPDATAALVTPDRTLARRVAVELARWGLIVDDSAGVPLDREPAGLFARLLAEVAASDADPVRLLALAKHPFAAFGMSRPLCRTAARTLEIALFRGHRVAGGIAALKPALATARAGEGAHAHPPAARRRLSTGDWDLAARFADRLAAVLGPIERAFAKSGEISAAAATALLLDALSAAASDGASGDGLLWEGAGGEALATLLTGVIDDAEGRHLLMPPAEYPFFLSALLQDVVVQRPPGADPRIHIWGTLEARLQSVDLLILGGLDEGVWPAATRTDPWLSRAMRAAMGLPPPERRLGLAAHDFAQAMAAPRVIVTRAEKREGAPTVESRWLQRVAALGGKARMAAVIARGRRYVALARALDRVDEIGRIDRPDPKPPVDVRPRALSVTEIETLIRDPYAIYAKRILRLEPLDPLGRTPDPAMRGTLVHDAIARFTKEWSGPFDAAAEARLIDIGRQTLAAVADFPDVLAIWSLRFAAIARWFVGWEQSRHASVAARHAEVAGRLEFAAPGGTFGLKGRADRIDQMIDGSLAIYDFKTGSPPTERQVFAGLTPQLTLETAMARGGGFGEPFAGSHVSDLAWIGLGRVGRTDPYESAVKKGETADGLGARAIVMLEALVAAYDAADRGYISRARPMLENKRYTGDYDHLARVREWSLVESEEDFL